MRFPLMHAIVVCESDLVSAGIKAWVTTTCYILYTKDVTILKAGQNSKKTDITTLKADRPSFNVQ